MTTTMIAKPLESRIAEFEKYRTWVQTLSRINKRTMFLALELIDEDDRAWDEIKLTGILLNRKKAELDILDVSPVRNEYPEEEQYKFTITPKIIAPTVSTVTTPAVPKPAGVKAAKPVTEKKVKVAKAEAPKKLKECPRHLLGGVIMKPIPGFGYQWNIRYNKIALLEYVDGEWKGIGVHGWYIEIEENALGWLKKRQAEVAAKAEIAQ